MKNLKKISITTSAKINIGLHVFGVRPDGFHNIESIFFPVNEYNSNLIGDKIEVSEGCFCGAGKVRILTSGITINGNPQQNSCVKAYHALDKHFNLPPVNIYLEKNVPIGAGLGGGSADGVYMLKALSQLFNLSLSDAQLFEFASALGSDCPFFINPQPALIEGRGEVITPLGAVGAEGCANRPIHKTDGHVTERESCVAEREGHTAERESRIAERDGHVVEKENRIAEREKWIEKASAALSKLYDDYYIKIIPSNIFISTPHAYSIVGEREQSSEQNSLLKLISQPIEQWQNSIVNDFEEPIFQEYPQLRETKDALLSKGAIYAAMTGSGSAIYGIFKKQL